MRILLICGCPYHPGGIPAEGAEFLKDSGHTLEICEKFKDADIESAAYDVVILSKSDQESDGAEWQTEPIRQSFIRFVERGGGLLAVHAGTVGGQDSMPLLKLIGCRFLFHPEQCAVTVKPVKNHPVTRGVGPFTVTDEHYYIDMLDPGAEILATAESEIARMPGCFVRAQGAGRVCALTPGHNIEVWREPDFQKLLSNAVLWCGGEVM